MATPKFDRLAQNLLRRIPTEFKTAFAVGTQMPDSHLLPAQDIERYINEGMRKLFYEKWNESISLSKGRPGRAIKYLIGMLPELVKFSSTLVGSTALQGTAYQIASPHLDIFKVIGAIGKDNQFIKVWSESKFSLATSLEYNEYTATSDNPAIIQMNNIIFVFPGNMQNFEFKIQYIAIPVSPNTGNYIEQNGNYDSPFMAHWEDKIVQLAYEVYLIEAQELS